MSASGWLRRRAEGTDLDFAAPSTSELEGCLAIIVAMLFNSSV